MLPAAVSPDPRLEVLLPPWRSLGESPACSGHRADSVIVSPQVSTSCAPDPLCGDKCSLYKQQPPPRRSVSLWKAGCLSDRMDPPKPSLPASSTLPGGGGTQTSGAQAPPRAGTLRSEGPGACKPHSALVCAVPHGSVPAGGGFSAELMIPSPPVSRTWASGRFLQ